MRHQAARSTAGRGTTAKQTQDRNLTLAPDHRSVGDGKRSVRGERDLRATPRVSSVTERQSLGAPSRRTIVIRGQVADRYSTPMRSSRSRRISRSYGLGMRPERAALWAVLLGVLLVVVALASAHM